MTFRTPVLLQSSAHHKFDLLHTSPSRGGTVAEYVEGNAAGEHGAWHEHKKIAAYCVLWVEVTVAEYVEVGLQPLRFWG